MPMNDKSNWEKSSDRLVALLGELAPQEPDVTVKKMFGWPCCFVNGNLFAGLHNQTMIFRLSDADQTAFLRLARYGRVRADAGPKNEGLCGYGRSSGPRTCRISKVDGAVTRVRTRVTAQGEKEAAAKMAKKSKR